MYSSSAPGNIFLFGEHSVVYSRPAIISAIGLKTRCDAEKRPDKTILISSRGYGKARLTLTELKEPAKKPYCLEPVIEVCRRFYEKSGLEYGVSLNISSQISRNSGGMSSSTAVLVSVLDALNKIKPAFEKKDYYNLLLPIQEKIHGGKASGAEIFSSTFGGYSKIRINPLRQESLGKLELPIMAVNTGIRANTSDTVPYVRRGWELDKRGYGAVFDRISGIVGEGEIAVKLRDFVRIGRLMSENHEILARDLGVSHPKLNKIVKIALENGAYGAKLSGGGKGGAAIILAEPGNMERIAKKLSGFEAYRTEIGVFGV
jgi:mevalonate kinase